MPTDVELTTSDVNPEESMVPIFSSSNHDAEMEAMTIKGILDASEIPALIVGPHVLPNLDFQVQVSSEFAERAREIIAEARAAGPAAAAAGELATE